jgi:hypothetical protein
MNYLHISTESVIGSIRSSLPKVQFVSFASVDVGPIGDYRVLARKAFLRTMKRCLNQTYTLPSHEKFSPNSHNQLFPPPEKIFRTDMQPLLWYGQDGATELMARYLAYQAQLLQRPLCVIRCEKYPGYYWPEELAALFPRAQTLSVNALRQLATEWVEIVNQACNLHIWDSVMQKVRGVPDEFFDMDIIKYTTSSRYRSAVRVVGEVLGKSAYCGSLSDEYLFYRIHVLIEKGFLLKKYDATATHPGLLWIRTSEKCR